MIKMYESIFGENAEVEMDEKKKPEVKDPAEQILEILTSKKFTKWYEGKFADYNEGGDEAPSKDDILADVRATFIEELEGKEKEEKEGKKEKPEEEIEEDSY